MSPAVLSMVETEEVSCSGLNRMDSCYNCDDPGCECYSAPCDCDNSPSSDAD